MDPGFATARLDVRPLRPGDRDVYVALYTDADLMRLVAPALSPAAAAASFAKVLDPASGTRAWTLHERAQAATIGLLGLVRDGVGGGEIGALVRAPWQGHGYACEAIARLVEVAFADPALARLHTRHATANAGALGLMAKLGFARVAAPDGDRFDCRWELPRARAPSLHSA